MNFQKLIFGLVGCIALFLSLFSYLQIALDEKDSARSSALVPKRVFPEYLINDAARSRAEVARVLDPLGFMVWPEQRQRLLSEAELSVQRELNLRPHDPELWRALLFLQLETTTPVQENYWAISNAARFTQWNRESTFWVAQSCFKYHEQLSEIDSELCTKVFNQFPKHLSLPRIARKMGVEQIAFEKMLIELGLPIPGGVK